MFLIYVTDAVEKRDQISDNKVLGQKKCIQITTEYINIKNIVRALSFK